MVFLRVAFWTILFNVLFLPQFEKIESSNVNHYSVYLNGTIVGITNNKEKIYDCYRQAKLLIIEQHSNSGISKGIVMTEFPEITVENEEQGSKVDAEEVIIQNMVSVLLQNNVETLSPAFLVKVNGTMVNLSSVNEVEKMLEDTVSLYDEENLYDIEIVQNNERELNVLTANIVRAGEIDPLDSQENDNNVNNNFGNDILPEAGFEDRLNDIIRSANDFEEEITGFDAYELGVRDVNFSADIEIVKAYIPEDEITDLSTAKGILTENQDVQQIYKVQSGDTLSEISLKVGLPLDEIISLNDALDDENSNIYIDQELLITVPEPELAVIWTVEQRICESYDLDIEYVYNDSWYTNKSVTLQQPSAGYREAIALITYENSKELSQEILYEEVYEEAVAKIVEVGTIVPPTYIKPLAGGRLSSGFGRRTAPTAGASTYHKGIDWATPVGTSVYASSGGVVVKAGWGSGYGYVVYINHPDGRQTRYGHLSRIFVSAGQTVRQGQVIAASGNTGRSSGPHVHFEILINGVQVNPLNYLY